MAWDERAIRRLAEAGVEQSDIAQSLGLVPRLAADPELRARFEAVVTRAHAAFRVALSKRLSDEGIGKGKASALLELARAWVARFSDSQLTPEEEQGLLERTEAVLAKLAEARSAT